jgi:hypothetical protein
VSDPVVVRFGGQLRPCRPQAAGLTLKCQRWANGSGGGRSPVQLSCEDGDPIRALVHVWSARTRPFPPEAEFAPRHPAALPGSLAATVHRRPFVCLLGCRGRHSWRWSALTQGVYLPTRSSARSRRVCASRSTCQGSGVKVPASRTCTCVPFTNTLSERVDAPASVSSPVARFSRLP